MRMRVDVWICIVLAEQGVATAPLKLCPFSVSTGTSLWDGQYVCDTES